MVGICHLTDSHHNHHGQKPTMVGICHGGNMLGNLVTVMIIILVMVIVVIVVMVIMVVKISRTDR